MLAFRRFALAMVLYGLVVMPLSPAPRAEAQAPALPVLTTCVASVFCGAVLAAAVAYGAVYIAADDDVSMVGLYNELRESMPSWFHDGVVAAVQSGATSMNVSAFPGYDPGDLEDALGVASLLGANLTTAEGTLASGLSDPAVMVMPARASSGTGVGIDSMLGYVDVTVPCVTYDAPSGNVCTGTTNAYSFELSFTTLDGEVEQWVYASRALYAVGTDDDRCFGASGTYHSAAGACAYKHVGVVGLGAHNSASVAGSSTWAIDALADPFTPAYVVDYNVPYSVPHTFRVSTGFNAVYGSGFPHKWATPYIEYRLCTISTCSDWQQGPPATAWTPVQAVPLVFDPGYDPDHTSIIPADPSALVGATPATVIEARDGSSATVADPVPVTSGGTDTGWLSRIYGLLSSVPGTLTSIRDLVTDMPGAMTAGLAAALVPEVGVQARLSALELTGHAPFSYGAAFTGAVTDVFEGADDECPVIHFDMPASWSDIDWELCMPPAAKTVLYVLSRVSAVALLVWWGLAYYRRTIEGVAR